MTRATRCSPICVQVKIREVSYQSDAYPPNTRIEQAVALFSGRENRFHRSLRGAFEREY